MLQSLLLPQSTAHMKPNKRPKHITATTEEEASSSSSSSSESQGLRLLGLLLHCAEAVSTDHLPQARDLLLEITELSSPFGSSLERVTAYFADALNARIFSSYLSSYTPLTPPNFTAKISQAFQILNSVSPLVKFSHFTANQAIYQALEGLGSEDGVHIIDFDIMQGLQWPGLFHILASMPVRLRSIRMTGMGASMEVLEATGRRLCEFAAGLGLPFEFCAVEGKVGDVADGSAMFERRGFGEVTVVHWMQHCLYDVSGSDLGTLRVIKLIRPRIVTIVEQDLCHAGEFLGRFVEALHYYSALFDALGDSLHEESVERYTVERQVFGAEIRNIVAVGGPKRTGEVKVENWGEEMSKLGFQRVSLEGSPAAQASLLLGMFPWKGYTLVEDNGSLKLGWKDLPLLTASAWQFHNDNGAAVSMV